jgi:DME family drug/metabolite transporter
MSTNSRERSKFAALIVILAGICFGTTGTSQSLFGKGINPLAIASSRLIVGATALWLISFRQKSSLKFPRLALWVCAGGVATYQLAFFSAVHLTGVAIATITALGSAPIFTGLLAWGLGHERPSKIWVIATSITTLGIIALNIHAEKSTFNLFGVVLALISGVAFSGFNVMGRNVLKTGYPLSHFISRSFALAALLISPFFFTQPISWLSHAKGIGLVLWLGIIATALAYTLYGYGLTHLHASSAATLVLAEPVTATILAVTVLHNQLTATSWAGVLLVIIGLLVLGVKG